MWKASAVRAREWARKPLMSSRRKNVVSMTIIILMRRLFDQLTRRKLAMAKEVGGRRLRPRLYRNGGKKDEVGDLRPLARGIGCFCRGR